MLMEMIFQSNKICVQRYYENNKQANFRTKNCKKTSIL